MGMATAWALTAWASDTCTPLRILEAESPYVERAGDFGWLFFEITLEEHLLIEWYPKRTASLTSTSLRATGSLAVARGNLRWDLLDGVKSQLKRVVISKPLALAWQYGMQLARLVLLLGTKHVSV